MKKHVVISWAVCLALVIASGLYVDGKYRAQVRAQKELMALYAAKVKTKANLLSVCVRELPHIVKPFIGEIDPQNVNIRNEHAECISMLEQFYIEHDYLIKEISVYNMSGDVFNIYRENDNSIMDVYKMRTASVLISNSRFVIADGYAIVVPVFKDNVLAGNVAVYIDIMSLLTEFFNPYIENDNIRATVILGDENVLNLPFDNELNFPHNINITQKVCEQKSGYITGKLSNSVTDYRAVIYYENLMNPDYCIGVAFSYNISSLIIRSFIILGVSTLIFITLTIVFLITVKLTVAKYNQSLVKKEHEINVLQSIYRNLPTGIIVCRDNTFISGNNSFFSLFDEYMSAKDTGKNKSQLTLPACFHNDEHELEFKNWEIIKIKRRGKEISLGRRQMRLEIEKNSYVVETFWELTEMHQQLSDCIQSAVTKSELLSRVGGGVKKTLNNIRKITAQLPDNANTSQINKLTTELYTIVTDVQNYADIEAGYVGLEETPFNIVDEIININDKHLPQLQNKGIELGIHISKSAIRNVVGDPLHFRQIVNELLSNAIKYTEKGNIRISIETTDLQGGKIMVKCSVDDTGRGIPTQKLKNIFSIDLRAIEEGDNICLDVVIIKKLVDIMGGTMRVTSPSPISTDPSAPGTQFSFSFVCMSDQIFEKKLDYSSIESYQQINVLIITEEKSHVQSLSNYINHNKINSDIYIYDKVSSELLVNKLIIDKFRYQIVVISASTSEISFQIAEKIHQQDLTQNCLYIFIDETEQKGNYIKARSLNMDYYYAKSEYFSSALLVILSDHFPNLSDKNSYG